MTNEKPVELAIVIVPQNATLRELRDMRVGLFGELEKGLIGEAVELQQPPDSRALDPAVVGAIGMILLPVVADKLGDLLVDYLGRNDCSITIKTPLSNGSEVVITFPPGTSSEDVHSWFASAFDIVKEQDE